MISIMISKQPNWASSKTDYKIKENYHKILILKSLSVSSYELQPVENGVRKFTSIS